MPVLINVILRVAIIISVIVILVNAVPDRFITRSFDPLSAR